jgi:hypothetical protein
MRGSAETLQRECANDASLRATEPEVCINMPCSVAGVKLRFKLALNHAPAQALSKALGVRARMTSDPSHQLNIGPVSRLYSLHGELVLAENR